MLEADGSSRGGGGSSNYDRYLDEVQISNSLSCEYFFYYFLKKLYVAGERLGRQSPGRVPPPQPAFENHKETEKGRLGYVIPRKICLKIFIKSFSLGNPGEICSCRKPKKPHTVLTTVMANATNWDR